MGKQILRLAFHPIFVASVLFAIFFMPMCDFVFQCGCDHIWSGAHHACNAFRSGDPDCPFCVSPFCAGCNSVALFAVQAIPYFGALLPAGLLVSILRKKKGGSFLRDLAVALVIVAAAFVIIAAIYALIGNYPLFRFR